MKTYQICSVLFFLLFIPANLFSQDILFKKNSSPLEVKIKNFDGKTVIYEIPGDSLGTTYYLSSISLDSLRYSDGNSIRFLMPLDFNSQQVKMIPRNYLGIELVNLLTGNVNLDFERSTKNGRTSFVAGFLINTRKGELGYWSDYHGIFEYTTYRPYSYFGKIGVNFFPFDYSLSRIHRFRLSTGFSVLLGSLRKIDYSPYYPYYEFQARHVTGTSLMWNLKERIYLDNHFQIMGGAEVSILPFLAFICPQVTFSGGF